MNDYFNAFKEQGRCNCRIFLRSRYQQHLLAKVKAATRLQPKIAKEVKRYLEWYWDALAAAETSLEMVEYEKHKTEAGEVNGET